MAQTYLTRTNSGTGSETKGTFSAWIKRGVLGGSSDYIWHTSEDTNNDIKILTNSSDSIRIRGINNGTAVVNLIPNNLFRDVSAWYHLVVAFDTTQSTEADRIKMYVNGVQITSFSTAVYPSQNLNLKLNQSGDRRTIGTAYDNGGSPSNAYWNGSMSHIHWVDGTAYPASTFGETDATTGEWKIKTSPSVTYGTNGFFILKDGNSVTDQSGNSNNFTVAGGTLTNTEDCPDNVFSTLNALATSSYGTLIQGNNTVKGNTSTNSAETFSTLSTNNDGKYYYEIKCTGVNGVDNPNFGFIQTARGFRLQNGEPGLGGATNGSLDIRVQPNGKTFDNGAASGSAVISTYTDGDILGFAIDSDNGAFYVSKNGVWQTSGNPESGASRTGAIKTWSPTDSKVTEGQSVCIGVYNTSIADANFGNGYFGTTAVTSAGTNASSNGIFEYDVPTGYTALSTKGLNL